RLIDPCKIQKHFKDFYNDLSEELNKYGEIDSLHICDNLDDHMVGNVYVQFGEEEKAATVVDIATLCTLKRSVGNCDISCLEALYQSNGTQNEGDPTNPTIFIGNLDASVTNDHLRRVFGNYGSCAEEALRALNGTQLGGQIIRLLTSLRVIRTNGVVVLWPPPQRPRKRKLVHTRMTM
ncbi:hypothetical protein H5410_014594, partial [Solanum commersonii]